MSFQTIKNDGFKIELQINALIFYTHYLEHIIVKVNFNEQDNTIEDPLTIYPILGH